MLIADHKRCKYQSDKLLFLQIVKNHESKHSANIPQMNGSFTFLNLLRLSYRAINRLRCPSGTRLYDSTFKFASNFRLRSNRATLYSENRVEFNVCLF